MNAHHRPLDNQLSARLHHADVALLTPPQTQMLTLKAPDANAQVITHNICIILTKQSLKKDGFVSPEAVKISMVGLQLPIIFMIQ